MYNTPSSDLQAPPPLNLDEARRFQELLDPAASGLCYQTFDDRGRDGRLARTLHGSLDSLAEHLSALNRRGAGVFAAVNEMKLGCPRTTANVIRVRALFADSDDPVKLPDVEAAIARFGLPPSLVVESSAGRRHYYWLTNDYPLEEFTAAQKKLVATLGTDPAVCDLPRVMRVPGFYHNKGKPFLSRLVHIA